MVSVDPSITEYDPRCGRVHAVPDAVCDELRGESPRAAP